MVTAQVSVGARVRAATINEMIGEIDVTGVRSVVPSSVVGAGVSVSSLGLISYTGALDITVGGCFTSAFRNYSIVADSSGTASNVLFQLRSGATTSATAYDRTEILARNNTISSSTSLNATSWILVGLTNTNIQWDLDVAAPALAVATTAMSRGGAHSNPAVANLANGMVQNFLTHRTVAAYDGFVVTFSGAQTGTLRIYGYN